MPLALRPCVRAARPLASAELRRMATRGWGIEFRPCSRSRTLIVNSPDSVAASGREWALTSETPIITLAPMRLGIIVVVALGILLPDTAHAGKQKFVKLILEKRTTLDVGQFAVLTIPSKRRYSVSTAGGVLLPVRDKRKGRVVYRAVGPGLDTIVVTPMDITAGGCVSCATRHYFVTVSSPSERRLK